MQTNSLLRKGLAVGIILLFLAVIILSVSASIVPANVALAKSQSPMINPEKKSGGDIIWDNGGTDQHSFFSASQYAASYPFDTQTADDFMFDTKTEISGLCWHGIFQCPPDIDPCDFYVYLYADDGTGNAPTGGGLEHPQSTALATYHLTGITGLPEDPYGYYQYHANLSPYFMCQAHEKYWIAVQAVSGYPPLWCWMDNGYNPDLLSKAVWGFPMIDVPFWTTYTDSDMAFYLVGVPSTPKSDLDCNGQLSWTDIKPGTTVTGTFKVMNIGEPNSHLNWTIASYPDWGTWTFSPSSGANLTPADGAITVNVSVTAPDVKNQGFQGNITVVNKENSSDYCVIPVTLTTPLYQTFEHHGLFERLLERSPHAFPILQHLLGY
jgi:hypothetical protein